MEAKGLTIATGVYRESLTVVSFSRGSVLHRLRPSEVVTLLSNDGFYDPTLQGRSPLTVVPVLSLAVVTPFLSLLVLCATLSLYNTLDYYVYTPL